MREERSDVVEMEMFGNLPVRPVRETMPIEVKAKRPYVRKTKKAYHWTAEHRRNFRRTMRAKRASKAVTERNRKPKARRSPKDPELAAYDYGPRRNAAAEAPRAAAKPLPSKVGREQREDAIVYLRAASERIAHASNAELLSLLALRRLEGGIK